MNIKEMSKYHHYIIISVLVYFIATLFLANIPTMRLGLALAAWINNIYFGYKLAVALGKSAGLWIFFGIIGPFTMWIGHLLLLNSANKSFRANGMKIGFLGGATKGS